MSKRGAERQISKDDVDDDIEEISSPAQVSQGFRKADDSALAQRQIKALPKRAAGRSNAPSPSPLNGAPQPDDETKSTTTQKFGSFGGFGASATPASSFTFTPPTSSSAMAATQLTSNSSPFGGLMTPSSSQTSVSFGSPVLSSSASAATKAFASAISSGTPAFTPPSSASQTHIGNSPELEYYTSLRGLNVSFLTAINTAVEQDPFTDVAGLLDKYKNLRTTVQSDFDKQATPSSGPVGGSALPLTDKPTMPLAMPSPPASFSNFKPLTMSTSSGAAGFIPSMDKTTTVEKGGGFSFPTSTSTSSAMISSATSGQPQSGFHFGSKTSETSSSTSTFSAPTSTSQSSELKSSFNITSSQKDNNNSSTSSVFSSNDSGTSSFGKNTFAGFVTKTEEKPGTKSSGGSTVPASVPFSMPPTSSSPFGSSVPNFFASPKPTPSQAAPSTKPVSAFAPISSSFGGGSNPFSVIGASDGSSGKIPIVFGSPSATSAFGSTEKPAGTGNPFGGFGSSSPPKSGSFGFGKGTGSIGNPVGFGFGNPVKDSEGDPSPKPSTEFSFTTPPNKSENTASPPAEESSKSTPPENVEGGDAEDDASKFLPASNLDEEGEGEENEETTYSVRSKVYKMVKTNDKSEWKDMGIGMLRLKKHKTRNVRRVLLRNGSTGKIIINFQLYSGFGSTVSPKSISFVGHDEGVSRTYRLRLKTDDQASELKNALDRESALAGGTGGDA